MLAAMKLDEIPARLRQKGRSQSDLARHLQLDPSSLTKTIKGERRLKADELLKIEAFFEGKMSSSTHGSRPFQSGDAPRPSEYLSTAMLRLAALNASHSIRAVWWTGSKRQHFGADRET